MKQIRFLPDGTTEIRDISEAEIDLWIQQQIEQEVQDRKEYEDWKLLAIQNQPNNNNKKEEEASQK